MGLVDLLEAGLGLLLPRIHIGMVAAGQPTEGLLNLLLRGPPPHPQNGIIVLPHIGPIVKPVRASVKCLSGILTNTLSRCYVRQASATAFQPLPSPGPGCHRCLSPRRPPSLSPPPASGRQGGPLFPHQ